MRLFRSKKQIALSTAPGGYSNEDPEGIIFDMGARLLTELNHWKIFSFILAFIAGGAVYTRNPPPSEVKAYGVSSDANGHAVVRQLTAYKPDDQAIRTALKETVESWFTIEPVLTDDIHARLCSLPVLDRRGTPAACDPPVRLLAPSGRLARGRPSA